jgi:hypothetical protein
MKTILITAAILATLCGAARASGTALESLSAAVPAEASASVPVPGPAQAVRETENQQIFSAEAAWSVAKTPTAIKQLGIMKAAEKAAVLECRAQGLSGCVAVASKVLGWDHFTIKASASARPLIPARKTVFTAGNRWTVPGSGFNALERLGVLKDAEEAAIEKCKAAGFLACFATDSNITSCDKWACSATALAMPFKAAE